VEGQHPQPAVAGPSRSSPPPAGLDAPREAHRLASRWPLLAILALAAALRLACWWSLREAPFVGELVMDSYEYDRWAQQLAAGDWLGSGTFFQAPLYPYLLGVVYRLGGHHPDLVYLLQIAVAVAGCAALHAAGRRIGGGALGLAAAAAMAVYGPFLYYDVQLLKESFAASTVCFLLAALVRARESSRLRGWLLAGLLLGVLALLRENALLVAPLFLPLTVRRCEPLGGALRRAALLVGGLALALLPVALRNAYVGGGLLPTTFNGGVMFYIGNHAGADGTYQPLVPGKQVPAIERVEVVRLAEQASGRRLSPSEVSAYWLRRALAWAADEPGAFARLQVRKLGMFWSWYEWPDAVDYYDMRARCWVLRLPLLELGGVELLALAGLWLSRRRLAPFAPALWLIAGWTLSTVPFFLFSRYRIPMVPALLLLAAVPLAALAEAWRGREARRAAALAALAAAALLLPRLAPFEARRDLVELNLALLAERRGDLAAAAGHYREVLRVSPDDFSALMGLGTLAARGGELPVAKRYFARAAELLPESDDAQANLGAAYLAMGEPASARRHLQRALELHTTHPQALQNLAVLRWRGGDAAGALELLDRLLAADPDNAAASRLRGRIAGAAAAAKPPPN
jgi:tetratricopeptide (TPR) repeat protein